MQYSQSSLAQMGKPFLVVVSTEQSNFGIVGQVNAATPVLDMVVEFGRLL
jgi:hypothetical protein